jgi:hypothetical protein
VKRRRAAPAPFPLRTSGVRVYLYRYFAAPRSNLEDAHEGNYAPLLQRVRKGDASHQELASLCDVFEGKIRRPRHRTKSEDTANRRHIIAAAVFYSKALQPRWLDKQINFVVGNHFGVSARTVKAAKAEIERDPEQCKALKTEAAEFAKYLPRFLGRGAKKSPT